MANEGMRIYEDKGESARLQDVLITTCVIICVFTWSFVPCFEWVYLYAMCLNVDIEPRVWSNNTKKTAQKPGLAGSH